MYGDTTAIIMHVPRHLHTCLHMKIVMFVLLSFINTSLQLAFSFLLSKVIPRPQKERESWLVLCDCILYGALHINLVVIH